MANVIAKLYLNEESPSKLLAATYDGTQDSTELDVTLRGSQSDDKIVVVFTNGTPGDVAHVSLYGEEFVPQGV